MKKRILTLLVILIVTFWINNTFAIDTVEVRVPVDLTPILWWDVFWLANGCSLVTESGDYVCNIPKWISWFQFVMSWLIKYLTFIAWIGAVLFIVVNWILYSMSWMDDSLKADAKKRIVKTLIWLSLLLLSWLLLHVIAPWVYM